MDVRKELDSLKLKVMRMNVDLQCRLKIRDDIDRILVGLKEEERFEIPEWLKGE